MARDPRTESLLKQGNYKYRYVEKLLFSDIDLKASEENPARLRRKIDASVVDQYCLAMIDGAVFPALVVFVVDQAKHIVGTGMHRIKAAKLAELDCHDSYIVTEPDQYRQELLIRLLNGIEGRRDDKNDQLYHICAIHEKYPAHSREELAKQFHFSTQVVNNFWHGQQGIKRASRLGFDFDNDKQPQYIILALNQIASDTVFQKGCELVHYYEPKGRTIENMVREIKAVKSKGQDAEMEVVKRYHDQAEEEQQRAKSRVGKTSSTQGTRYIGRCRSLNRQSAKGIEHLHLSALVDARDSLNVVLDTIENLQKVKDELERIIRMSGGSATSGLSRAAAPIC